MEKCKFCEDLDTEPRKRFVPMSVNLPEMDESLNGIGQRIINAVIWGNSEGLSKYEIKKI